MTSTLTQQATYFLFDCSWQTGDGCWALYVVHNGVHVQQPGGYSIKESSPGGEVKLVYFTSRRRDFMYLFHLSTLW